MNVILRKVFQGKFHEFKCPFPIEMASDQVQVALPDIFNLSFCGAGIERREKTAGKFVILGGLKDGTAVELNCSKLLVMLGVNHVGTCKKSLFTSPNPRQGVIVFAAVDESLGDR